MRPAKGVGRGRRGRSKCMLVVAMETTKVKR